MSKLTGAALDRAVANALGLKSVHNCEKWGSAPIKREGDIVDPDECTWGCDCDKCQAKYKQWKEAFDTQQKQYEEKNT